VSDDFNLDTHCVVCQEPRSTHPTESNNPFPLFDEGRACRDCDAYITASRLTIAQANNTWVQLIKDANGVVADALPFFAAYILRYFMSNAAGIRIVKKRAVEMMQAEADRLSAEQTAREEAGCPDCGYIEDDVATHYENCVHFDTDLIADDDTEEDWS